MLMTQPLTINLDVQDFNLVKPAILDGHGYQLLTTAHVEKPHARWPRLPIAAAVSDYHRNANGPADASIYKPVSDYYTCFKCISP